MTKPDLPATFQGTPTYEVGEPWIGYIRVSTWKEEKISDVLQKTAIEAWAARTGRRIVDWVIDLDATGRNFKRKIMRGIERVERGEAKGIAVWRYSRFGRNRTGNAANLARLEAVGGQLESATEAVDARTAVGELFREITFAFGNYESNRAGEQWRETHEHRHALQLPATGRGRFGYIWHPRRVPDPNAPGGFRLQDERYELHPEYASVAEELYERKLAREGFAALAHWLNDELEIRTSRGNRWRVNTVQRYLDAGFAAGLLRTHDPECPCQYGTEHFHKCKNDRMIYLAGAQPAIITPDQWQQYQEHRKQVKNTPPRARAATYITTNLNACGNCRGTAVARSGRGPNGEHVRGHTFVCSNHKIQGKGACPTGLYVRRDEVEREVVKWLKREAADGIDNAPSVPHQRTAPQDPRAQAAKERAHTLAELAKVDAALDRLVTDHAMDPEKYPADTFARVRDQLAGKKGDLVKDLQALSEVEATPHREEFRPLVVGLIEEWDTIMPIEANALLRQLIRRVVITARKSDEGARWKLERTFEIHPVWEPDPWAADR
ncbi:recombinase family protein [Streptomyces chryseus]